MEKKVQKNVDARFNKSTSKRLHNVRIKEGKKCTRERESREEGSRKCKVRGSR